MRTDGLGRAPRLLAACLPALLLCGCVAYFPVNARLERWDPEAGYRLEKRAETRRSDDLLLLLAFSGGGMRAAAFAYGALEELAATRVEIDARPRRLVDEVGLISGVSGGSFTAAYFALYGDRIFQDFEPQFLKRNIQLRMLGQLFKPQNWLRLLSSYFSRTELAAEYLDRNVFNGATFGDLEDRDAPRILINATDFSKGYRFGFEQRQFDWICSDLSRFKLSRAVTASSAVPLLLSPVILRNHAGRCGFEPPAWIDEVLADPGASTREVAYARSLASHLDRRRRRYIHLIDGGVADNLGIRGPIQSVRSEMRAGERMLVAGHESVREIVVIVVNAQTEPGGRWDRLDYAPPLAVMLDAVTSVQLNRYSFETLELLRDTFEAWAAALSTEDQPVHFRLIEVNFDAVRDPKERRRLNRLPTSLNLGDEAVDRLREAARRVLRESPVFQELLGVLPELSR